MTRGLSRDCQMMEKILESPRKSLINDESSRTSLNNVESASNNAEQARTMMKVPRTMLNKKGCWVVMAWRLWGHVSGVVGVWGLWVESLGCDGGGVVVIIFLSLLIVTTGSWGSWVESPGSMLNNGEQCRTMVGDSWLWGMWGMW